MTLLLAATGQTIVLLRGGIDLSIGGMISFGTVLAATRFGDDPKMMVLWAVLIVAIGAIVGLVNGVLITVLKLQPFLVTLATWSILSGAALIVLPTDGGALPDGWMSFGSATFLGASSSVWLLLVLILFWVWFKRTRLGVAIRATGSNERSARPMVSPAYSQHSRRSTSPPRPVPARRPSARTISFLRSPRP
jgi:ribose transport system permease protein